MSEHRYEVSFYVADAGAGRHCAEDALEELLARFPAVDAVAVLSDAGQPVVLKHGESGLELGLRWDGPRLREISWRPCDADDNDPAVQFHPITHLEPS